MMATVESINSYVDGVWEKDVMPTLLEYIGIPNVSAVFEANWEELGHMERAAQLLGDWAAKRPVDGMQFEIHRLEGRSPVLFAEIEPANGGPADTTVFLYGHLDKQPEVAGWREGLDPWTPVMEGDKLYGRGGADDGYATFAAFTAIEAAQQAGFPHARLVVLIEASEESGSRDLPAHVEALADRIGTPSLIVCLDSGCLDYDRLWLTTSLRGLLAGQLDIEVTTEGVHSGDASGVIPSTFRIARMILSRLEDEDTGMVLPEELRVPMPPERVRQAAETAEEMTGTLAAKFPFLDGVKPAVIDPTEQLLNRTWRAQLEITGADGFAPIDRAGNVLRAKTSLYLSLRLPPTLEPVAASDFLERLLTEDPPYGAKVSYRADKKSTGWDAPATEPWLEASLAKASTEAFGNPARAMGEGGSISFMGMLGRRFPEAQFVVTGVLGPGSNAHGPNEFLHVPTARKVTAVVANVLRDHAVAFGGNGSAS
jgi:acetylornithine deacetylase/succinyl-diaminopimelate desuccinylase-like protein